jgi:hypothetical protein
MIGLFLCYNFAYFAKMMISYMNTFKNIFQYLKNGFKYIIKKVKKTKREFNIN